MGKADAQLAGEAASYDARLVTYDLKRLPADANADAFSARVTDAFDNVIPYLERGFKDSTAIGAWVLKQCPDNYAPEARTRYEAMSYKTDPHAVASMIASVISNAQAAKGELVKQTMSEYVGIAADYDYDGMPILLGDEGGRGGGRRPGGLGRGAATRALRLELGGRDRRRRCHWPPRAANGPAQAVVGGELAAGTAGEWP